MKLIVEDDRDICQARIDESISNDDGKYHPIIIKGTFAKAEYVNKNKRIYPYEMLKKEFDRFIDEDVKHSHAWGEFEHPPTVRKSDAERRQHAAIFIMNVEPKDDKTWFGTVRLMATDHKFNKTGSPAGDLAKSFYDASDDKNLFGFSTRGFGDLSAADDKGIKKLTGYHLESVDLVMNPSCDVFAEGILESKEFMLDTHGQIVECVMNDAISSINESARTYDLGKKREILKAAWDTLLKRI